MSQFPIKPQRYLSNEPRTIGSLWDGLNEHLLATFTEIDMHGNRLDNVSLRAPLTESNFEVALQWQSPFEASGSSQFSAVQQLLQSGVLQPLAEKADSLFNTNTALLAASFEGKTSVTKLNSTQIFVGQQPAKFNITVCLRAWRDPIEEVMTPMNWLMEKALPVELSRDGLTLSRLLDKNNSISTTAFPSQQPSMLSVKYKDCTYWPLVIESISKDTNAPIDKNGNFVEMSLQLQLSTLAAIDRADYRSFTGGQ